jgi:hypothetical protein
MRNILFPNRGDHDAFRFSSPCTLIGCGISSSVWELLLIAHTDVEQDLSAVHHQGFGSSCQEKGNQPLLRYSTITKG